MISRFASPITVALFYLGWFGCVLLAESSWTSFTPLFPIALLIFQVSQRLISIKLLAFAIVISVIGIAFDSVMLARGLISVVPAGTFPLPIWLASIWPLFSLSMVQIGSKLSVPLWLGFLLGFIFGPLSYKAGAVFEVLLFTSPLTFWIYAIFWGLAFPLILRTSRGLA